MNNRVVGSDRLKSEDCDRLAPSSQSLFADAIDQKRDVCTTADKRLPNLRRMAGPIGPEMISIATHPVTSLKSVSLELDHSVLRPFKRYHELRAAQFNDGRRRSCDLDRVIISMSLTILRLSINRKYIHAV